MKYDMFDLKTGSLLMQAVLLASIRQGKRLFQRLEGPHVPPPGAYTSNRCLPGLLPPCDKLTYEPKSKPILLYHKNAMPVGFRSQLGA